jgi:hypothetical protein
MSQSWTASEPGNSGNPNQQWCLKIFARIYVIDNIYDIYALFAGQNLSVRCCRYASVWGEPAVKNPPGQCSDHLVGETIPRYCGRDFCSPSHDPQQQYTEDWCGEANSLVHGQDAKASGRFRSTPSPVENVNPSEGHLRLGD